MGGSAGISVIEAVQTHNSEVAHADLAGHISRGDPTLLAYLPPQFKLNSAAGLEAFNAEISRQAAMVAYVDDFKLLIFLSVGAIPLLLLLRAPKKKPTETIEVIVD